MDVSVSLRGLTKHYGSSRGIEDISFDVHRGEVFGFLGPNGSGKTTALRTLVGLIHATSGSAQILGENALRPNPALSEKVGYLPGSLGLYSSMTGRAFLRFLANVRRTDCSESINGLARRLKVDLDRRIQDLSKGNRQKIGVIQAFMHQPQVLLLDEPTSGLDPLVQHEFETLLEESKSRGAAIILSSHVLSEVEHLADRVAIINEGSLLVVASVATLKERALRSVDLHFDTPPSEEDFRNLPGIRDVSRHGKMLTCSVLGSEHELLVTAVRQGVVTVTTREPSLDEVFFNYIESGGKH
jgi:ABC-2 type transport system ATP-binding protein